MIKKNPNQTLYEKLININKMIVEKKECKDIKYGKKI